MHVYVSVGTRPIIAGHTISRKIFTLPTDKSTRLPKSVVTWTDYKLTIKCMQVKGENTIKLHVRRFKNELPNGSLNRCIALITATEVSFAIIIPLLLLLLLFCLVLRPLVVT